MNPAEESKLDNQRFEFAFSAMKVRRFPAPCRDRPRSKLGRRVPKDIGVAFLFRTEAEKRACAGVDENYYHLGRVTVDLVVEKIHTNQFWPFELTKEAMVKGLWRYGPTMQRKLPAKTA